MLYCYYCGSYYNLDEINPKGLCLCQGGYLFELDIESEDDIEIPLEDILC